MSFYDYYFKWLYNSLLVAGTFGPVVMHSVYGKWMILCFCKIELLRKNSYSNKIKLPYHMDFTK